MNILHINTFDNKGGAARAAYRIHSSLKEIGVSSEMLVAKKKGVYDDKSIKEFHIPFFKRKKWLASKILSFHKKQNVSYISCNLFYSGIHKIINQSKADIVHLHWIGNEMISISEIRRIKKKIVWTLHDMWAFSGTEHYDDINYPGRYRFVYSKKNRADEYNGIIDIDAWIWRKKKKYWRDVCFNFVTPSKWLAKCLSESSLFFGQEAVVIPNCLDIDIFKPAKNNYVQEKENYYSRKKLILFGAVRGKDNELKGFLLLKKALVNISSNASVKNLECIIFGGEKKDAFEVINGINIRDVGQINDDKKLAALYSSADVFVTPSLLEAFGQTASEAHACGTPVVAFNNSGLSDIIEHKKTGYLAEAFSSEDLAAGIAWVLADEERLIELGIQARKKAELAYNYETVGRQYKELYNKVLSS